MIKALLVSCAAALALAAPANAITVNEADVTDRSGATTPIFSVGDVYYGAYRVYNVGTADVGRNTVFGSIDCGATPQGAEVPDGGCSENADNGIGWGLDYGDAWGIAVPAGHRITGLTLTVWDFVAPATEASDADAFGSVIDDFDQFITGDTVIDFAPQPVVYENGDFLRFRIRTRRQTQDELPLSSDISFSYAWTIDVAFGPPPPPPAVPLPASLWLLLAGVSGLAAVVARQRPHG